MHDTQHLESLGAHGVCVGGGWRCVCIWPPGSGKRPVPWKSLVWALLGQKTALPPKVHRQTIWKEPCGPFLENPACLSDDGTRMMNAVAGLQQQSTF